MKTVVTTPKPYVLVIDDQKEILEIVSHILSDEGYEVCGISDSRIIVEKIRIRRPDVVLLDVWLNDSRFDGVAIFDIIKQYYEDVPVVMISGHSSIDTAVDALKRGVFDFLAKPFSTDQLVSVVGRAMEMCRLRRDYEILQAEKGSALVLEQLSPIWESVCRNIKKSSSGKSRFLFTGEVGVGKSYFARYVHDNSPYKKGSFVEFDAGFECSDDDMFVALFGQEIHDAGERSVVTIGALEKASRGTVYLKNIHQLNKKSQEALLKTLETSKFKRVGGQEEIMLEARIVSSSQTDIQKLVERGLFLKDLYYRLNIVEMEIPMIRTFGDSIIDVMTFFIKRLFSKKVEVEFDRPSRFSLEGYSWPGNLRELRNVAEWLVLTVPVCNGTMLISDDILGIRLGSTSHKTKAESSDAFDVSYVLAMPMRQAREYFEQYYLEFHLRRHNRNFSRTAEVVGMERTALHRKMRQLSES